jgi:hypothetical protein
MSPTVFSKGKNGSGPIKAKPTINKMEPMKATTLGGLRSQIHPQIGAEIPYRMKLKNKTLTFLLVLFFLKSIINKKVNNNSIKYLYIFLRNCWVISQ